MLRKNISQISLQCWALGGAERQAQTAQGAVLSLQRSVDNTVPLLHLAVPAQAGGIARSDIRVPELCEGGSPVGTRASAAFQADQQADQAQRN